MNLYRRAARVLAEEGLSGLLSRAPRGWAVGPSREEIETEIAAYRRLKEEFREKTRAMGREDLADFLWYHTIDLGNGLVTPGDYDYRSNVHLFDFPDDMTGMSVLDVGSATGFFAFEFARRGANVTSVELPSIADWDMPLGEDRERTLAGLMELHKVTTVEEVQYRHLDGPFEFCRSALGAKITRVHSTVYDLSPEKVATSGFDLVFAGDVLLHTFSPLKALAALTPLCRGKLIIAQDLTTAGGEREPVMKYVGGAERGGDNRSWWLPNRLCLEQILKRLGFRSVSVVGHHTGVLRPEGYVYDRAIIHAVK